MRKLLFPFVMASVIVLTACSGGAATDTQNSVSEAEPASNQALLPKTDNTVANFDQTALPAKGEEIVVMETDMGTVKLRLFPELTPKAVENFKGLIKKGFYDGLIFHRVIPNFMIQGGDPKGNGTGGESIWGGEFNDEITPQLHHLHGALAMANSGANTNGSQFYIVQNASGAAFLDGGYTIFGQAFEGLDVVDKIANTPRDAGDKPLKDVKMTKVTLETY